MSSNNVVPIPNANEKGIDALLRLFEIAHRNSGQPRIVARFLLSLYNGDRFPFDLSDFRSLDSEIFEDCLLVLQLDNRWSRQVHRYVEDGDDLCERLAQRWGFHDHHGASWR